MIKNKRIPKTSRAADNGTLLFCGRHREKQQNTNDEKGWVTTFIFYNNMVLWLFYGLYAKVGVSCINTCNATHHYLYHAI